MKPNQNWTENILMFRFDKKYIYSWGILFITAGEILISITFPLERSVWWLERNRNVHSLYSIRFSIKLESPSYSAWKGKLISYSARLKDSLEDPHLNQSKSLKAVFFWVSATIVSISSWTLLVNLFIFLPYEKNFQNVHKTN